MWGGPDVRLDYKSKYKVNGDGSNLQMRNIFLEQGGGDTINLVLIRFQGREGVGLHLGRAFAPLEILRNFSYATGQLPYTYVIVT